MSLLVDILLGVFRSAAEVFVVHTGEYEGGRYRDRLWAFRISATLLIIASATVLVVVPAPVRWIGAPTGLLGVIVGSIAEWRYAWRGPGP